LSHLNYEPYHQYLLVKEVIRYYGVMEDGKIKVRGLEIRRRDTLRFVFDAQTEMIDTLSIVANNTADFAIKYHLPLWWCETIEKNFWMAMC
jgi:DNA polymerase elongation subunit (family B)